MRARTNKKYYMQDYALETLRDAAILTSSYVAGTVIGPLSGAGSNPALRNQLNLMVEFTIGSLTTAEIKVEYSIDGTTYFQETFENVSGGTATMTLGVYQLSATGNYVISIPIKFAYIKVSVKGTGTATSSSMAIKAIIGTV